MELESPSNGVSERVRLCRCKKQLTWHLNDQGHATHVVKYYVMKDTLGGLLGMTSWQGTDLSNILCYSYGLLVHESRGHFFVMELLRPYGEVQYWVEIKWLIFMLSLEAQANHIL